MQIREPLPLGIRLTRRIWIPAALLLAALPPTIGICSRARETTEPHRSPATPQQIAGRHLTVDAGDEITGPVSIKAMRCELSGSFPATVSFLGRKLVLAPGFRAPVLDVRCAIIEGDRSGVGRLEGSYQSLREPRPEK